MASFARHRVVVILLSDALRFVLNGLRWLERRGPSVAGSWMKSRRSGWMGWLGLEDGILVVSGGNVRNGLI